MVGRLLIWSSILRARSRPRGLAGLALLRLPAVRRHHLHAKGGVGLAQDIAPASEARHDLSVSPSHVVVDLVG